MLNQFQSVKWPQNGAQASKCLLPSNCFKDPDLVPNDPSQCGASGVGGEMVSCELVFAEILIIRTLLGNGPYGDRL